MTKEVGAQQYFVCQRRCGQRYSIYLLLKCKQGQQTSDGLLESVRQSQPRSKGEKKREKGIRLVLMLSVNFLHRDMYRNKGPFQPQVLVE
jgi:hypothetical protein